jgi:3-hydroxyacyl-CoA dehydrogenase
VAKKVGIAVGPLAILDKINLKCMLVIMIKDSHLMCYDFNLLQTLVTITETHWRGVNRGSGFCDYDERGNGQKLYLPSSLILTSV